jgi:hypothetical protein
MSALRLTKFGVKKRVYASISDLRDAYAYIPETYMRTPAKLGAVQSRDVHASKGRAVAYAYL